MNRSLSANRESTQRNGGPSPFPSWPLPLPLPRREGRDHRDTPIRRTKASCCPLLVSTIAETLCVLCMPKAFCGLEMCAKKLRKLCALCERKTYPHTPTMFFFSQKNTDEQNTQSFTETLSQPISQNVTANRSLTPSPSPNGEGSDHRGYPSFATCVEMGISTLPSAFCSVPS